MTACEDSNAIDTDVVNGERQRILIGGPSRGFRCHAHTLGEGATHKYSNPHSAGWSVMKSMTRSHQLLQRSSTLRTASSTASLAVRIGELLLGDLAFRRV